MKTIHKTFALFFGVFMFAPITEINALEKITVPFYNESAEVYSGNLDTVVKSYDDAVIIRNNPKDIAILNKQGERFWFLEVPEIYVTMKEGTTPPVDSINKELNFTRIPAQFKKSSEADKYYITLPDKSGETLERIYDIFRRSIDELCFISNR